MHRPVLLAESLELLAPVRNGTYVDCTLGAGGHAAAILEASGPDGRLLGLDADGEMLEVARARLAPYGDRVTTVHANFERLDEVAEEVGYRDVDGVLFDLGVASPHFDDPERGFSFQGDGPLDMRLDRSGGESAADLLHSLDERELADVIYRYGEESRARQIARAVVAERRKAPIQTTAQLANLVARLAPRGRTHAATRTFQALRIAVNRELSVLPIGLRAAHSLLRDGGRLAVISFHSLEDRIVKQYMVSQAKPCVCPPRTPICVCARSPTLSLLRDVAPSAAEIASNPRSRSARLRCASRIGPPLRGPFPPSRSLPAISGRERR